METTMALLGCTELKQLNPSLLNIKKLEAELDVPRVWNEGSKL
jgi:hypothetical protein